MDVIRNIEVQQLKADVPKFGPGDTIRVGVRVVEGSKVRQQAFQGTVMMRSRSGVSETVTVRKITDGVGIERIFPIHSPNVESIELIRRGRVRRARLTYLRGRKGKSARIRELSMHRAGKSARKKVPAPAAQPKAPAAE
jgi:large subunit ribosomal protein L19